MMKDVSVILIEPRNSGNIGSIARAMKNFGLKKLILVSPKCNHMSQHARNLAKHAQDVLKAAKVRKRWPSPDCLVATTAKLGRDYNIPRSPITPEQLSSIIRGSVSIVFGREDRGLTNREIRKCDFAMHIPAAKSYPTMNISHAAAIVFYELSKAGNLEKTEQHGLATATDKEQLLKLLDTAMGKMGFATEEKKETQRRVWKKMIGKSFLTRREAFALFGFFKKLH